MSRSPQSHEADDQYQADDNAAYIRLSDGDILESAEVAPNVVFDYDADGRIVGIELLDARAQLSAELLTDAA
jgi:YD repeat-containing protein